MPGQLPGALPLPGIYRPLLGLSRPSLAKPWPNPSSPPPVQYFGTDGAARSSKQRSQSPPESKDSGSGDEGDTSDGMSSSGSGNLEVSEAAHQIASAMCAAQQLPGEPPQQVGRADVNPMACRVDVARQVGRSACSPPGVEWGVLEEHARKKACCAQEAQFANCPSACPTAPPSLQLLELASLLHAYGLVSAVPTFPPAGPPAPSGAPLSPDSRRQQQRQRQKSVPKLNADGSVRLNARQRRTLRRAQERAMKALLEAQTKAHGISSEQVGALGGLKQGMGQGGRGHGARGKGLSLSMSAARWTGWVASTAACIHACFRLEGRNGSEACGIACIEHPSADASSFACVCVVPR